MTRRRVFAAVLFGCWAAGRAAAVEPAAISASAAARQAADEAAPKIRDGEIDPRFFGFIERAMNGKANRGPAPCGRFPTRRG